MCKKNLAKSPFFPGNHLHSNCSWANKAYRPYVFIMTHLKEQNEVWSVERDLQTAEVVQDQQSASNP